MQTNQNSGEDDRECFKNVGIVLDRFDKKIKGDLYMYPEDFTVREVHPKGICSVEKSEEIVPDFKGDYIHGLLVKKNISTFEACSIFCRENGLDYFSDVSFCGLKDTLGITSQLICIKNKPSLKIKRTVFDDFFITNLKSSDRKLQVGDHVGNNFIIRVRNVSNPQEETMNILKNFNDMTMKGLPNFYGLQRFGVRQDNHVLGKLLLKEQYEEFSRKFITYSRNEPDEIAKIRGKLAENFGDWNKCLEIIGNSKELSDERDLITSIAKGNEILSSIKNVKLSDFFLHSYSSYLFNIALSSLLEKDYRDVSLEKIGSNSVLDELNASVYGYILESEGIVIEDFKKCPFHIPEHPRSSLFRPVNFEFSIEGSDVILSFTLGKGEYASLLLYFLVDSDVRKLC